MAVIYSRKRIRLPKVICKKSNFHNNKNKKRIIKFMIIVLIAIVTFAMAISWVDPIFETLCKDKARSIATIICNEETTKIIKQYQYEDIVTIYKDKNEKITMIKSNIRAINLIISDVAEKIQKRIDGTEQEDIGIKLGSFTGSKILMSIGPTLPIKLATVGNVQTDLRSEFEAEGINQTIHRIYLQIDCQVNILTPYNVICESISNQLLIAENIIVGEIPDTFYNLEGMTQDDVMEVME